MFLVSKEFFLSLFSFVSLNSLFFLSFFYFLRYNINRNQSFFDASLSAFSGPLFCRVKTTNPEENIKDFNREKALNKTDQWELLLPIDICSFILYSICRKRLLCGVNSKENNPFCLYKLAPVTFATILKNMLDTNSYD